MVQVINFQKILINAGKRATNFRALQYSSLKVDHKTVISKFWKEYTFFQIVKLEIFNLRITNCLFNSSIKDNLKNITKKTEALWSMVNYEYHNKV